MLAKLYLPYYPEGGFANDENDMSDEEYANTLLNNFGASYSRYMDNMIGGFVDDRYNVMDPVFVRRGCRKQCPRRGSSHALRESRLRSGIRAPLGRRLPGSSRRPKDDRLLRRDQRRAGLAGRGDGFRSHRSGRGRVQGRRQTGRRLHVLPRP